VPPTERDMLLVALRTARSRLRKGTKRLGIQDARALCDTYLRHYSFLFFDSLMFRLVVVVVCRFVRFFKQLMNNWRAYYKVRSIRFVSKSNIEDQSFNQSINTEPIFPPPPITRTDDSTWTRSPRRGPTATRRSFAACAPARCSLSTSI
jgi:hypothetical protein